LPVEGERGLGCLAVRANWHHFASGVLVPRLRWEADYLTTLVAVFGTTISPYLFSWQSAEQVRDIIEPAI
jgi:Mn2+/Fe2+ NRAMP family transporter